MKKQNIVGTFAVNREHRTFAHDAAVHKSGKINCCHSMFCYCCCCCFCQLVCYFLWRKKQLIPIFFFPNGVENIKLWLWEKINLHWRKKIVLYKTRIEILFVLVLHWIYKTVVHMYNVLIICYMQLYHLSTLLWRKTFIYINISNSRNCLLT